MQRTQRAAKRLALVLLSWNCSCSMSKKLLKLLVDLIARLDKLVTAWLLKDRPIMIKLLIETEIPENIQVFVLCSVVLCICPASDT